MVRQAKTIFKGTYHHSKRVVLHRTTMTVVIWVICIRCSEHFTNCDLIFAALGGVFQDEIARATEQKARKRKEAG